MVVRMSIFRKKTALGTEAFRTHWKKIHAPIAMRIPGLQRYEQNVVVGRFASNASSGQEKAMVIDGICKLLFPDPSAMQGVFSPEMKQQLMDDEAKFIEALRTFVVDQEVVVSAAEKPLTKIVAFVTRGPGVGACDFTMRWKRDRATWAATVPGLEGYTQNFVTSRTIERGEATYEQVPIDCIDEIWVGDRSPHTMRDAIDRLHARAGALEASVYSFIVDVHVPTRVEVGVQP
ncbi:EthD protein (plasmid) [Variovorax sp. SRS16]|nr:EthD protein [Variovorax sp. SRS16]